MYSTICFLVLNLHYLLLGWGLRTGLVQSLMVICGREPEGGMRMGSNWASDTWREVGVHHY